MKIPTKTLIMVLLFICSWTLTSTNLLGQNLCEDKQKVEDGADDFSMPESVFEYNRAMGSVDWLENDLWQVLREYETIDELMYATERFGIPYPNSVRIVKGALLRQQALLANEHMNLLKLKYELGKATKDQLKNATKQFHSARQAFCNFLEEAEYVD